MGITGRHIIELAKITDYLLSATHPTGRTKAAFFRAFGFDAADPVVLMDALEAHARSRPVVRSTHNRYGTKREIRCELATPDGRNPCIVAIWLEAEAESHRFITAYPAP